MKSFKKFLNAKTLSPEQIAKKHGVSVDYVNAQIEAGSKIEKEHTKDQQAAEEIAKDHIGEFPDYYERLDKLETQAKKKWEK